MMEQPLWVRDVDTGRVVASPLDHHTDVIEALDISYDYDYTVFMGHHHLAEAR